MSLGGKTAMVFSGGLGLAAYHAGVYEVFAKRGQTLHLVIGSPAAPKPPEILEFLSPP
jgi:predicted acylesterase/phospholipase RssA